MLDINWDNRIIIRDPELEGELCDWYGILRTFRIRSDNTKNYINFSLDRTKAVEQFGYLINGENLDTKLIYHFKMIDAQIKTLFRKLLRDYGVGEEEVCELIDYNPSTNSFSVQTESRRIEVGLRYPNEVTRKHRVALSDSTMGKEYVLDRYHRELSYDLVGLEKKNRNRKIHRSMDVKHYYLSLTEGKDNIFIDIRYPEELEDIYSNFFFDGNLIERNLLSCEELPIIEIYEMVISALRSYGYKFEDYPSIVIQKGRTVKDLDNEVTDRITIKNGEFESFIYTKGNKKVYINDKGEWSVEDAVSKIKTNEAGKIDISIYGDRASLMDLVDSPHEMYSDAKADVCVVRMLSKVLLDNAKKATSK